MNGVENFDYTGNVVCAYLQKAGYYKLEVWGARGGNPNNVDYGGRGGYSFGKIYSNSDSSLYIVVGGAGKNYTGSGQGDLAGGYNGGGIGEKYGNYFSSSGGGATHISVQNCGELKNCSSYKGAYDSSKGTYDGGKILIVAGGGGGGGNYNGGVGYGGNGGGKNGGTGTDAFSNYGVGTGGIQSGGGNPPSNGSCASSVSPDAYNYGKFGEGGYGIGYPSNHGQSCGSGSGGGGGLYGGAGGGAVGGSGGGGSGYIGNSLLLSDKGMYQYSGTGSGCTTDNSITTKTVCTASTGAHIANRANTGDGYARITYLGT